MVVVLGGAKCGCGLWLLVEVVLELGDDNTQRGR